MTDNTRLLQAAQLLLDYAGGTMQRTNLNKALFYLDLYWYQETGETYTGARYVAIERGPVVDHYKTDLIAPLLDGGIVAEGRIEFGPGMTGFPLTLQRRTAPHPTEHLEVLARRVAAFAVSKTAFDISEFSHENLGWRTAFAKGSGSPINMLLALQQITPEDPWVCEPLADEDIARLGRLAVAYHVPFE